MYLAVHFDENVQAIWSRQGRRDLNHIFLESAKEEIESYQAKLEDFLLEGKGEKCDFTNGGFLFRYASGGALPILEIGGEQYYCFFYREVAPIGWNIANGGCDTIEELLDPLETIKRELNEELIIIDPKKKIYVFGKTFDHPEFLLIRKLLCALYPDLNFDDLEKHNPSLTWEEGPDQLKVQIEGQEKIITGCFVNINASDFGIEVDRIVRIPVEESSILLDGELGSGGIPGSYLEQCSRSIVQGGTIEC